MRIGFCVILKSREDLQRSEFYRQDLEILEALGHEVVPIFSPAGLLREKVQLAFVWWWNYLWAWGPVARLRRIPMLVTGTFDIGAHRRAPLIKRKLKRAGARLGDVNVFVSRLESKEVPAFLGLSADRCLYSPHVVDTSFYRPPDRPVPARQEQVVLNVTWQKRENMERKQLPELIEAFAKVRSLGHKCRLILAGPPMDGGGLLREQAKRLNVSEFVEFPGQISREEKRLRMQECDVYVQASRFEGFGVAIAEAMACGALVIVSNAGATPEVVGDCGLYTTGNGVDGIATAVSMALTNPGQYTALRERACKRVNDLFSRPRRKRDLERAIEIALGNGLGTRE